MGRKKKADGLGGDDLLSQPAVPSPKPPVPSAPQPIPAILEYRPLGASELWRVERFETFAAEFGLAGDWAAQMTQFHELAARYTRGWLIAKKIFGIGPMILPVNAVPEDYETQTRAQVCAALGIDPKQLQAELDALRVVASPSLPPPTETTAPVRNANELALDDTVLKEFGFEEDMFSIHLLDPETGTQVLRSAKSNRTERDWFVERATQWQKMLREPMASTLARQALLNDLSLKRFEAEMARRAVSSTDWKRLYELKKQVETVYQEQIDRLQELFPEMGLASKVSFRAVISDLNRAHREYYGNHDNRLVDKIFAATEMEVMLRMSQQSPEPQYRMGLNVSIVEAMHNLYDPNFRSQIKPSVLRKLDVGFKAAVMKMREETNEPLVDLEKGVEHGEGDDYPDLGPKESEEATRRALGYVIEDENKEASAPPGEGGFSTGEL